MLLYHLPQLSLSPPVLRRSAPYLRILRGIHLRDEGRVVVDFDLRLDHSVVVARRHYCVREPLPSLADDLLPLAPFARLVASSDCGSSGDRGNLVVHWVGGCCWLRVVHHGLLLREIVRDMKLLAYL